MFIISSIRELRQIRKIIFFADYPYYLTNLLLNGTDITTDEQIISITDENKSNLERQKDRLVSYANAKGYQVEKIVTEIGSGLNDNRPKLEKLLIDKTIDVIIVEHKDRLARFGINYIEKLLALDGRKIEIVNPQLDEKNDLMQDFVSIITSFCARLYGKRRTKRQTEKLIQELSSDIEK